MTTDEEIEIYRRRKETESRQRYYQEHKEKIKAYSQKYYAEHQQAILHKKKMKYAERKEAKQNDRQI